MAGRIIHGGENISIERGIRILFRDVQASFVTENKLKLLCDLWDVAAAEEHKSLQGALHHHSFLLGKDYKLGNLYL